MFTGMIILHNDFLSIANLSGSFVPYVVIAAGHFVVDRFLVGAYNVSHGFKRNDANRDYSPQP